jgi:hypothetical protein
MCSTNSNIKDYSDSKFSVFCRWKVVQDHREWWSEFSYSLRFDVLVSMKQGMGLEQVRKVLWHNTDNLESKFIPCLLVVVLCVCVCVCVCGVCVCVCACVHVCVCAHTGEWFGIRIMWIWLCFPVYWPCGFELAIEPGLVCFFIF